VHNLLNTYNTLLNIHLNEQFAEHAKTLLKFELNAQFAEHAKKKLY